MTTSQTAEELQTAFSNVSANYKGSGVDIHALCKEKRLTEPVMEADIVAVLGVPTNAGDQSHRRKFTLFKYADVMRVLRDADTFTSGFIAHGMGSFFDGLIITAMDGEEHRRTRALLQPVFLPAKVNTWRDQIDRMIRQRYIEPLVPKKQADLMEFGLYFPIEAIYLLIGFPENRPDLIQRTATQALAILSGLQVDPAKAAALRSKVLEANQNLYDDIMEVVKERRAENAQGNDLISSLLRAEYEGRTLDDHEITTFVRSLLPAAGETTTRTFGSVMTLLLERPALLERVRQDRTLISKVIDETARYEPVATFKIREVAKDVEIGGVQIPKGAMVQCMVTSANRDEEVFDNPDEFNIDRKPKPTFGFGFGPHVCIGQYVAKMELTAAINAVLDLLPNLRLDPTKPAPKIEGGQLRGASMVHVIWD